MIIINIQSYLLNLIFFSTKKKKGSNVTNSASIQELAISQIFDAPMFLEQNDIDEAFEKERILKILRQGCLFLHRHGDKVKKFFLFLSLNCYN